MWYTNEEAPIAEDEKTSKATCICADDPMWWSTYDSSEVSCQPGTSKDTPKKDIRTKVKNKDKETKHTPLSDMSSTDNTENIMDTGAEVSAPVNPDLVIAPQPN